MTDKPKYRNLIDEDVLPTHFIEENYPGQYPEQMPIYLCIDMEETPPTVYVETYNFQQNGIPADIWHNRRLAFQLPNNTDASQMREWIDTEFREMLEGIIDNFEVEWNGNNYIGVYKNGMDELSKLEIMLENNIFPDQIPTIEHGGLYWPEDWFGEVTTTPDRDNPKATITIGNDEYVITSKTTEDELKSIEKVLSEEMENDNIVLIGGLMGWLEGLKEDCEFWDDEDDD